MHQIQITIGQLNLNHDKVLDSNMTRLKPKRNWRIISVLKNDSSKGCAAEIRVQTHTATLVHYHYGQVYTTHATMLTYSVIAEKTYRTVVVIL